MVAEAADRAALEEEEPMSGRWAAPGMKEQQPRDRVIESGCYALGFWDASRCNDS